MKNKKGFTLIELLAVIVILGVLLAIAVPSVSKYISVSKKSTYIDNAQSYASVARDQAMLGTYKFPVKKNDAVVIYFDDLANYLDKGGKNSPYGAEYDTTMSFVLIANVGEPEDPKYEYYIAAIDADGYGIGDVESSTPQAILYNDLTTGDIVQLGTKTVSGKTVPNGFVFKDSNTSLNGIQMEIKEGVTFTITGIK